MCNSRTDVSSTVTVLSDDTSKISELLYLSQFLSSQHGHKFLPQAVNYSIFITWVLLMFVFMPKLSALSFILAIVSRRPSTKLAIVAWLSANRTDLINLSIYLSISPIDTNILENFQEFEPVHSIKSFLVIREVYMYVLVVICACLTQKYHDCYGFSCANSFTKTKLVSKSNVISSLVLNSVS